MCLLGGGHSEGDCCPRVIGYLNAGPDLERLFPLPALAERAAQATHGQGHVTVTSTFPHTYKSEFNIS